MNNGKYEYVINSNLGQEYRSGVETLVYAYVPLDKQFNLGNNFIPLTMTVDADFEFPNPAGDFIVVGTGKTITFTTDKYIVGVDVTTSDGNPVSVFDITGTDFERIIAFRQNNTFGKVTLTMLKNTPLNYSATIGGIESTYIDDGVNRPVPTVTYKENANSTPVPLTEGVDYTVSYNVGPYIGTLTVTGIGEYTGSKTKTYNIRQPQLSDFTLLSDGSYGIASSADLDKLAKFVNNGNNCSGVTFRQTADISYTYTNAWDYLMLSASSENNYTPIGCYGKGFRGTYDGQNHTISGIRVYKCMEQESHDGECLGLFGYVSGGTVQNVVLRDSNIAGDENVGGIVGNLSGGSIKNSILYQVCTAAASVNNAPSTHYIDIIVGLNGGTVSGSHCRECYTGWYTYDNTMSHPQLITRYNRYNDLFSLATTTGVTISTSTATGVIIDAVAYYTEGSTFTLGYSGTVPDGSSVVFSATGGTVNGNMLTMSASDVTVSAVMVDNTMSITGAPKDGFYWATFYHSVARYTLPEGVTAYTMDAEHYLYRLGDNGRTIPKNTAVVIISDKQNVTLTYDDSSSEIVIHGGGNILRGSDYEDLISNLSGTPYVLSVVNGVLGFREYAPTNSQRVPAHKAYYVE